MPSDWLRRVLYALCLGIRKGSKYLGLPLCRNLYTSVAILKIERYLMLSKWSFSPSDVPYLHFMENIKTSSQWNFSDLELNTSVTSLQLILFKYPCEFARQVKNITGWRACSLRYILSSNVLCMRALWNMDLLCFVSLLFYLWSQRFQWPTLVDKGWIGIMFAVIYNNLLIPCWYFLWQNYWMSYWKNNFKIPLMMLPVKFLKTY